MSCQMRPCVLIVPKAIRGSSFSKPIFGWRVSGMRQRYWRAKVFKKSAEMLLLMRYWDARRR